MHACDGMLEKRRSTTVSDGGASKSLGSYLEQERLFQEQFKDVMEQRKSQQAEVVLIRQVKPLNVQGAK
jgi:hypothetical protein